MKQLILKELREQYKVALIGMVVLAGMLMLASVSYGSQLKNTLLLRGNSDDFQPLLQNELLIQAAFFFAVFGTLLGWLQIRAEKAGREAARFLLSCLPDSKMSSSVSSVPLWLKPLHPN